MTTLVRAVRKTLISACRGEIKTHHSRKITYKELWVRHSSAGSIWGRGCTRTVVDWIVKISDDDIARKRPPLNALVVRRDTKQPGVNWEEWHKSCGKPYKDRDEAQNACWSYWSPLKKRKGNQ